MFVTPARPVLAGLLALTFVQCGGGSSPTVPPPVTTLPAPAPTPSPTPTPGSNDCVPGGDCSTNKAPVARTVLRLYRLFDNRGGWFLPTPDPVKQVIQEPIPVGFTMLFDVTGRDKDNKETLGPTGDGEGIRWYPSDDSLIEMAGTPSAWQRKYQSSSPGSSRCS